MRDKRLQRLERFAERIAAKEEQLAALRADRDALIVEARDSGLLLREIAHVAGVGKSYASRVDLEGSAV